jgi:hypothetical protein
MASGLRHSKRLKERKIEKQVKNVNKPKGESKKIKPNRKMKVVKNVKRGRGNNLKVGKTNKRVSSISVPPSSPKSFLGNYNNVPGESPVSFRRKSINVSEAANSLPDNVKDSFDLLKILQNKRETSKNYGIETKKKIIDEFTKDHHSMEKIVATAKFKAKSQRVNKHPWSLIEIESLKRGVAKYGEGNWAKIRDDPELPFHNNKKIRNNVAIKDKWRNVKYYIDYSARPIRYYALLDKFHRPYRTGNDNIKVYKNRWPRDAAMKAATKNEFYPTPEATETVIYVKEIPGTLGVEPESSLVHVYRAHRHREAAVNIDKFKNIKTVWQAEVEKVREEKILSRHEAFGEYQ